MIDSKNILYLMSFMLLLLTGCEADTPLAHLPDEGEEPVEVRLYATAVGASIEVSRAANFTETSLQTNRIGMYGHRYENIPLECKSTTTTDGKTRYRLGTTDGSGIFYPAKDGEMYVYAYAPYSEEAYDNDTDSVFVMSSNHEWEGYDHYLTDPLWAKASITAENPEAMLTFGHRMSRLKMYLVNNKEEKEYKSAWIQLVFDRAQYGKMSIETGGIISENIGGDHEYGCSTNETLTLLPEKDTTEPQYDHTILPGSKLTYIWIQLTDTDDEIYTYEHRFSDEDPFPAFESGETNKIVIKVDEIEALNE